MSIWEYDIQLACEHTTGLGDSTPNAHRVLSWLLNFGCIEGNFTNEHFQEVATYVQEHYVVKAKVALGAASDPMLPRNFSHPRLYPRNRQHRLPRPKTTFDHLFIKKEVS